MSTEKSAKLKTAIEKELHEHMTTVMESTIDSIVLHVRRNNVPVDRDTMTHVLELFRKLLPAEHFAKLDGVLLRLDSKINEFTQE